MLFNSWRIVPFEFHAAQKKSLKEKRTIFDVEFSKEKNDAGHYVGTRALGVRGAPIPPRRTKKKKPNTRALGFEKKRSSSRKMFDGCEATGIGYAGVEKSIALCQKVVPEKKEEVKMGKPTFRSRKRGAMRVSCLSFFFVFAATPKVRGCFFFCSCFEVSHSAIPKIKVRGQTCCFFFSFQFG